VWQLYFGIIFIGIVMFAPGGIAGLLMMHRPLVRAGTLGMVIPSYLLALVPTLVLVCGVILGIETLAHYTESQGQGNMINVLGIPFDTTRAGTWIIAAVMIVGGFVVARMTWRRIADAWDRATTGARDRGHLA
jgi:branched-chain amino acid transport system permease protein